MGEIDFSKTLVGYDGKAIVFKRREPVTDEKGIVQKDANGFDVERIIDEEMTLGAVCSQSLVANNPKEQADGEEKYKRHRIAARIYRSVDEKKSLLMMVADITLLKKQVGFAYGALASGPAWEILEPDLLKKEAELGKAKPEEKK